MKNFIILFSFLLTSCGSCLLSQIPPQKIYTGSGCTAVLPNYLSKITASDNCEIASFTQVPAPGYALTPTNKTTNVTVKATDASGNFRQIVFTVTLLDTIKPVLTVDPTLLTASMDQISTIYDYADRLVENQMAFMDKQVADTNVFPESTNPNLRNVYEDSTFYKKVMITWTAPGLAINHTGKRIQTFANIGDTIILK